MIRPSLDLFARKGNVNVQETQMLGPSMTVDVIALNYELA